MSRELQLCVANNVSWYEAVLRTHGLVGATAHGMWTCDGLVPPYHSNAISVEPGPTAPQIACVRELRTRLARPFTVKDSFASLDLAPLGFRPLFDAEWIWRDPTSATSARGGDVEWRRVTTPPALERWETAWREGGSPAETRVFLPGLLYRQEVAIFGGHRDGRLVAGFAANRSIDVVGLTNAFSSEPDASAVTASALDEIARFAAGRPIVGYDRGEALRRAHELGFRTVGPLRVWTTA